MPPNSAGVRGRPSWSPSQVLYPLQTEPPRTVCSFISGLQEQYGLTVDDLDDYVYVGGDRKGRLTYFRLKYPGEVIPEHSQTCVCGHAIEENCFIRNTQTGHTLIIGTCCNKNFVTTSGKNCQDCGAPHSNKVVDRCNDCRRSKCDDCGARCRPAYKTCYDCYTSRSGKTASSQTVTVTTAPVKDHPCAESDSGRITLLQCCV